MKFTESEYERCRTAGTIHDLESAVKQQESYIEHLEQRIRDMNQVLAEIRMTVGGNVFSVEPIEEPDVDAPWLPVGLITKIDSVMEREYRE